MTILYHGTGLGMGLKAAEDGAILSQVEQHIRDLERLKDENPQSYDRHLRGRPIEEVALEMCCYRSEDNRIKSVCLSDRLLVARSYANKSNQGGLVLGVEFTPEEIKKFRPTTVIHVPKRVSLDRLREVHITLDARLYETQIKRYFDKYHPTFFLIK